jgi:hypothetical protein
MDMEDQVREALVAELRRQAEAEEGALQLAEEEGALTLSGRIDLDELTMAIVGSLAGGP